MAWLQQSLYNMVKNKYSHSIDLKKIRVKNTDKDVSAKALEALPYQS